MDFQSVGGDGYWLSKAICDNLYKLITMLSCPIALPPTLPDESVYNTFVGEMTDTYHCDVLQEDSIVFTLKLDNKLYKRDHAAATHEKTNEILQQRKKKGILIVFHYDHLILIPSLCCYQKAMNIIQMMAIFEMGSPEDEVIVIGYCKDPQVVLQFDKGVRVIW